MRFSLKVSISLMARWVSWPLIACPLVLGLTLGQAQAQERLELDEAIARLPTDKAAEVTARIDEALRQNGGVFSVKSSLAQRTAVLQERRAQVLAAGEVSRVRAQRSVVVSARCAAGRLVRGSHQASASDVRIIDQQERDCSAQGCQAYQVTAVRDTDEPFELEVSVACAG